MEMINRSWVCIVVLLMATACGSGGGSSSGSGCPNVVVGTEAGWPTIDEVANCEGCSSGSYTFTCSGESRTVTCVNGEIKDNAAGTFFGSTGDCTEGGLSCFNGAVNTSCVDTASE
ncbi:MAG: hypothetical protein HY696_08460 [Deltaproteobacteria bacterium]|nr:hypothetical protein [Deltaproteobacteria bacterium]